MNESTISVRYAKALFESAREKNQLDATRKDMLLIQDLCRISEFQFLLRSPMLNESKKCKVIGELLDKKINDLTSGLINLVVHNGRELLLSAIARNFIDLFMKHHRIKPAKLITASPLEKSLQDKIVQIVKETLDTEVELQTMEDKALIGGFIMRIDDQQYDASMATSLKRMKKKLLNT